MLGPVMLTKYQKIAAVWGSLRGELVDDGIYVSRIFPTPGIEKLRSRIP